MGITVLFIYCTDMSSGMKVSNLYSDMSSGMKVSNLYSDMSSGMKVSNLYSDMSSGMKVSNLYSDEIASIIQNDIIDKHSVTIYDCDVINFFPSCVLEKLIKLIISNSNLSGISFNNMMNIRILDLRLNNLDLIDDSILNLKKLMYIDISFNRIEDISILKSIVTLKKIEANCNIIKELPDFSKLESLEYLSCYNNEIEYIPSYLNTNNLKYFNIANNKITDVPSFIFKIEYYNTDFNNIKSETKNIIKYKKMEDRLISYQYSDEESIHNTRCQSMLRESICKIINRYDKYCIEKVLTIIDSEEIFDISFKDKLLSIIDYKYSLNDESKITFGEILGYVFKIIYDMQTDDNMINIFYSLVKGSICNLSWLTNSIMSIATFIDCVVIEMDPIDKLAGIIFSIKKKLEDDNSYTVEEHKNLVRREFKKNNISNNIISIYLDSIDEL